MPSVRRSISLTLADSALSVVLQFAASVTIARLIAPGEIGVFTIASLLMAIAGRIRDFGIGEFLVQAADDNDATIRSALWLNACMSWATAAVVFVASWWVADLYDDARIGEALRWMTLSFVVIPFGAVSLAVAQRRLDFRPMFVASLCANVLHLVTAVSLALAGFGFRSLVFASVAGVCASVVVAVLMRPRGVSFRPAASAWPAMVSFGSHIASLSLISQAGRSMNELLIGKFTGIEPTAFYSRAAGLVDLFSGLVLRALSPLTVALYASDARAGASGGRLFLTVQSFYTGVGWPFLVVLAILAEPVVLVLYGPAWGPSVPVLRVLCVAALIELTFSSWLDLLVSRGAAAQAHRMQIACLLIRLPGLALIVPFGMMGAAFGVVASSVLVAAFVYTRVSGFAGLSLRDAARALAPSAATAVACALAAALGAMLIDTTPGWSLAWLAPSSILIGVTWCIALARSRHPLWPEILRLIPWRRDSVAPPREPS